ncbi:MAG: hypothetical protein ACREP9_10635 [Candidatus Dormibacteraceae bacterium]
MNLLRAFLTTTLVAGASLLSAQVPNPLNLPDPLGISKPHNSAPAPRQDHPDSKHHDRRHHHRDRRHDHHDHGNDHHDQDHHDH